MVWYFTKWKFPQMYFTEQKGHMTPSSQVAIFQFNKRKASVGNNGAKLCPFVILSGFTTSYQGNL